VKFRKFYIPSLISATWFLGLCLICGCSSAHATQQHPDEVDSVVRALMTNGFGAVNVSQDRSKGVMTLTGPVQSQERKTYAADLARVNASDYVIANELTVTPPPPTASELIVDKYKVMLQARKDLDLQDIDYKAENRILILSGSVHNAHQRAEAVKLAKGVPNVERVIDEIKVRP
jgi:osmotically-inducible protein OsmY